jgi:hypothetical protein
MGKLKKKICAKTIICLIDFSQNLSQAMWKDNDQLSQLPHMDSLKVRRVRQIKKQISLDAFCRLTPESRLALKLFPDEPEKL